MRYALFLGCNIPARVQQYEASARSVLAGLGIDIEDIKEFNCCGYPLRNSDFKTFILFSARNLALAERMGLNVITLCKCCYGSMKMAEHYMEEDSFLKDEVNETLAKEGLEYNGNLGIKHFLSALYSDIGINALKEKITKSFKDLKIATHYGCHVLRPSNIMQFDNPVAPVIFDRLVELTGAKSIDWALKLECCGAPVLGINDDLSMNLTEKKLADGKQSNADYLCTACPWCHLQFDSVQKMMIEQRRMNNHLPAILFPQLLGLAMGIDKQTLGINMNQIDISAIEDL
ncbi:MAG: CoB--CoM heterodisulfide reductase iron-sulfur subunit B family protein [Proteobacteria bacterium]|nr:CoB--CoM heterodisulfide reductase iron-sulfur subunit B family protein [Pseudomonadota bacterium]MBU4258846.1 CoB--CoM heterodisulfide reductase iron-sulfur subunit B family protein [Pseudomonadota bacterium]MBU4287455.1 CoB--CoM heterodisulfide reductase iron-sulfur subunit B family protein [Pseudomonadota bacterium]MBU4413961.1 CoB--CoM heterodisulfide reductase iron-sulfur subunit B family protein [Pseudomonadota bacterium]